MRVGDLCELAILLEPQMCVAFVARAKGKPFMTPYRSKTFWNELLTKNLYLCAVKYNDSFITSTKGKFAFHNIKTKSEES